MRLNIRSAAIGALVVLGLIVLLQNTQVVTFKFLLWQLSMSRIILVPLILLAGFIAGFFIGRKSW